MKFFLVTGGVGYIGSHTAVELLQEGHQVVIYDNLYNSSSIAIDKINEITKKNIIFVQGDIRDKEKLNKVFEEFDFEAVLHFAGLKAVDESINQPMLYYNNNVYGSLQLLDVMANHGVKKIVFSSSATVYSCNSKSPLKEDMPLGIPSSPYGTSKLIVEKILSDLFKADEEWRIVCLRYFNPVGAHPSGLIGENPKGMPNNLMPILMQTALGKKEFLNVYGGDYPTPDGSAIRDYIHVVDLAKGHIAALKKIINSAGLFTLNIGTGSGFSVLEVIKTFEKANNLKVPFRIVEKRTGDVAVSFADTSLVESTLGWKAKFNLAEICIDSWNWQNKHPNGYIKSIS